MPIAISRSAALLFLVVLMMPRYVCAQDTNPSMHSGKLFDEIARMDRVLFDAFNMRDIDTQKAIFSKDIEFYHDKGGVTNYDQLIENTKQLFARNSTLRRTLVPESLEIYPIENYGAIQIGAHTFCHTENDRRDCGTFKFVHIWQKHGDTWKLSRVISYGH